MSTKTKQWLSNVDEYNEEYRLTPGLRAQAQAELRENTDTRRQALQHLREWFYKHPRIINCRLDCNFLLRFLRAKKFSTLQSQEAIERYLLLRQCLAAEFRNLDFQRPEISELFDTGFLFPTPGRDQLGRRIIIVIPGRVDPYRHTREMICRAVGTFGETLLESEEVQIRGLVYFCDGTGVSLPYLTLCTPREAVRLVKNGERTVPLRHKEIIGFNIPSAMKFVLDFGMSLISEKLKKRVKLCRDVNEAHHYIDKKLLPKEYGGEMTMANMMELWRAEMSNCRLKLLSHDQMTVDLTMYTARARCGALSALKYPLGFETCISDNNCFGINGSFRKLEVD